MALARVVAFDEVDEARIDALRDDIERGERPGEIPASEFLVLHDPEGGKALAILFFDSEEDYRRGDATLDAMPAGETPGRRASVSRYQVAIRKTV